MKPKNPCPQPEPPRAFAIGLALAAITLIVYLPVCFQDFAYFDDADYVTDNPMVSQGITWAGIKWAFTSWHASNWHPLTWLSHMLDCQWFGLNAGPQHFVNVLFHAANVALLFALLFRLTRVLGASAFVAALFAWHPLHVESVAWIAERKDVLSTFFGLLALWSYTRYVTGDGWRVTESRKTIASPATRHSSRFYWLALFFFALGLMSKPMLVTLPFVLLLLDYWPLRRVSGSETIAPKLETRNSKLETVFEKIPFFVLSAISCVLTFFAQRAEAVASLAACPPGLRVSNALVSYAAYLVKMFWPVHLAVIYPLPKSIPLWQPVIAGMMLVAVSFLAIRTRRDRPWLLVGWLWFLGTLVPVIGLVQVGSQAMADRYSYLPFIGVFMAIAFEVRDQARRRNLKSAPISAAAGLALIGCVAVTEYQLPFWRDPETLLTRALAVTKNNPLAHQVLGSFFYDQNHRTEALAEFREALQASEFAFSSLTGKKYNLYAHLALADEFKQHGQFDEALAQYRLVLNADPTLAEAHNDLGNLLDDLGQPADALAEYSEAVRLKPNAPPAHENLGAALLGQGRFDEAMEQYREAARLDPNDARPHYLMGKARLRSGNSVEAIKEFNAALKLAPDDYQTLTFLARVLASDENAGVRHGTEAIALAEKANTLSGGAQPFVLDTLAMAYAEGGRFSDAQQTARKAIELAAAASQSNMIPALEKRLELYRSGVAYREAFTNAAPR